MPESGLCRRRRTASNVGVEVNHIVIPAQDQRATARFLAYVLGLEAESDSRQFVRLRSCNGLTLEVSELTACGAFQCALLVTGAEFKAALDRIIDASINFFAAFDRTGRGEINREHGERSIYFDDPDGHLFELIEQADESGRENRIKAVAIKYRY